MICIECKKPIKKGNTSKDCRSIQCADCTTKKVNFIRMLEHETEVNIKDKDYFGLAYNLWKSNDIKSSLHKKLRKLRLQKGFTRRSLSYYLGINYTELSKMERGRKSLSKKALAFIGENNT